MTSRIARGIAGALVVSVILLTGCGGEASGPGSVGTGTGGSNGAGGSGGSSGNNGKDAGGCGTLLNGGPTVQGTRVAQIPPTPIGGSLASGTYYLTSYTVYTEPSGVAGPSNRTHRGAFAFDMTSATAGTAEIVDSLDGGANQYRCGSLTIAGTALTITTTSPPGAGVLRAHYSATATEVQFQVVLADGTTLVYVLVKQ